MIAIIDLNDVALSLWFQDETLHSPGYVLFDGASYRFGTPAMRTSRRTPKAVNTRFWSQLTTQPLAPTLGTARHAADLAHSHLAELHSTGGKPEHVMLAAPGSMTREQLSLLLGIVEHLPFAVSGLIHRSGALACASRLERGFHIELQLHQTLITGFETREGILHTLTSQSLPGQGLLAIQDRLATSISALFVNQTRFDPLRSADTEQALYDALPALLSDLQKHSEAHLAIAGYEARVTRDDLSLAGKALAKQLAQLLPHDWPVLLEAPLGLLPGFDLQRDTHGISAHAMVSVVLEQLSTLEQAPNALMLQRQFAPAAAPVVRPSVQTAITVDSAQDDGVIDLTKSARRPTHFLDGHIARPLKQGTELNGGAILGFDGDTLTLSGTVPADFLVNGAQAHPGQILTPGDTLTDALGLRALLICVDG